MFDNLNKLNEERICVRILGNTAHLSRSFQHTRDEQILSTKLNEKVVLNVALNYSAHKKEIRTATKDLVSEAGKNAG